MKFVGITFPTDQCNKDIITAARYWLHCWNSFWCTQNFFYACLLKENNLIAGVTFNLSRLEGLNHRHLFSSEYTLRREETEGKCGFEAFCFHKDIKVGGFFLFRIKENEVFS